MYPLRLLLLSSRASQLPLLTGVIRDNIILVRYEYETSSLSDIIVEISRSLQNAPKATSIAFLMHCSETEIFMCFPGRKVLNAVSVNSDPDIREFLCNLVDNLMAPGARAIDFFNCCVSSHSDGEIITREMQKLLHVPVRIWKDITGAQLDARCHIGYLYFHPVALQGKLKEINDKSGETRLEGYEKIRTVGKGAFGTAILYRRVVDDSMVVIKEINMVDLTASERQMALNEVQVLSILNHPHIISYLGSFERDGVLMIEMEYADKGTLAQMLAHLPRRMEEKQILYMFSQIVEAIRYMHSHNILHRDLKTANVFLNKANTVKVGDFGISKVMSTRSQAQTVLGTPYYISPEMCEGKQYDQKSDIWALGCILYEMACLQKTFEGSNLPALVNKIMKGHFEPVPLGYSQGLRQLIHDLLQRDPVFRPTAADILERRLPFLLENLESNNLGELSDKSDTSTKLSSPNTKSVLYELNSYKSKRSFTPIMLPPRCKIQELAVSNTHAIALTSELLVYTWGEGGRGELGHGKVDTYQHHPRAVEALKGKSVKCIGAGDGFSVFVSDSGMVMTCGDGTFGCLGHGDWNNALRPKLVEKLLSVDVNMIECGSHHVAVVGGSNDMFTWGRGAGGRLGLGHEEDSCLPMQVHLERECVVKTLRCGGDCTAVISTAGMLWACGYNTNNKLALMERRTGILAVKSKKGSEKILTLSRVVAIRPRVADISLGQNHCALITESGFIITFGRNSEGQLGRGHLRSTNQAPHIMRMIGDKVVTSVKCGPTYTVAGTAENSVYIWGTRYELENSIQLSQSLVESRSNREKQFHKSLNDSQYPTLLGGSSRQTIQIYDTILEPEEVLALYASPSQIAKGETVHLAGVYPCKQNVLILVDSSTPLARMSQNNKIIADHDVTQSFGESNTRYSATKDDFDSIGVVPAWIQAELAQSEAEWVGCNSSIGN